MRGKELFEKLTDVDDEIIIEASRENKPNKKWYVNCGLVAACIVLIFTIGVEIRKLSNHNGILENVIPGNEDSDNSYELGDKEPAQWEVYAELNNKIYSVVESKKSPAFDNYNLEKKITAELIGEYLGEQTIIVDNEGNRENFKIYRYSKAPITKYNWYPRVILKNSKGEYYHGLIGSPFKAEEQSAEEVLNVYGVSSYDDIISIENTKGKKITNREFIEEFYNGLFTKEYGDEDFLQENVYQNTGVDESEIGDLYTQHADDMVFLKVELKNGLVIDVDFTSHNYVRVNHGLYYKVSDEWLELVSEFK